jgi:DNA polymerase-3 subunit alpha
MAYLKTHYPLEYFTVLLSASENSADKVALYIQSARDLKINVIPPSINESSCSFHIKNKSIVFGFNSIKGIGNETISKILEARNGTPKQTFQSYIQAIAKLANAGVGMKTIETLIKAGTFNELLQKESRHFLLVNLPEIYQKINTMTTIGEFIIKPVLQPAEETAEIKKQLEIEQFNLLGVSFVEHPLISVKQKYHGNFQIVDLFNAINAMAPIHCLVNLVGHREIKTKTGQVMAFAKIEDDSKIIDIAIFPSVYEKIKHILKNGNYYIVTIRTTDRGYQALA